MSRDFEPLPLFEQALKTQLEQLDKSNFQVHLSVRRLFICGGEVDVTSHDPKSFRDKFQRYTADKNYSLHDDVVLAEDFKDYYKNGDYGDLLTFEDDLAYLSTIVIIFLESPGALVELGLYCSRPQFYKKLLIVVSEDEVKNEDSFIYLGPIEYIKKKSSDSAVLTYPFSLRNRDYSDEFTQDLCDEIESKLNKLNNTEKFDCGNSGHIALLIAEIIRLCFPIQLSEIEFALNIVDVNAKSNQIKRLLYLLEKMRYIKIKTYSRNKFYYPCFLDTKLVAFGKTKQNKTLDSNTVTVSIRQSWSPSEDVISKRRRHVLSQIHKMVGDE